MSARRTKFYLDKREGKAMGVCAGLADYTGIDVILVRVGVVLLTIFALGPVALVAYLVLGWLAKDKPREFYDADPAETKFWQGVRAKPSNSVRDVRARFRDIDRRLADVETHVTSHNSRLAAEIDALR
ncbi:MAG: phage shock protein PspC [Sphingomonas bacterium]|jgi:phage shock protein C|nr:phage shock protein PspC [Sphingomonas bacterium]MDB5685107.1 phage shock protein PspC [Sphingomonas bacterium]